MVQNFTRFYCTRYKAKILEISRDVYKSKNNADLWAYGHDILHYHNILKNSARINCSIVLLTYATYILPGKVVAGRQLWNNQSVPFVDAADSS